MYVGSTVTLSFPAGRDPLRRNLRAAPLGPSKDSREYTRSPRGDLRRLLQVDLSCVVCCTVDYSPRGIHPSAPLCVISYFFCPRPFYFRRPLAISSSCHPLRSCSVRHSAVRAELVIAEVQFGIVGPAVLGNARPGCFDGSE